MYVSPKPKNEKNPVGRRRRNVPEARAGALGTPEQHSAGAVAIAIRLESKPLRALRNRREDERGRQNKRGTPQ